MERFLDVCILSLCIGFLTISIYSLIEPSYLESIPRIHFESWWLESILRMIAGMVVFNGLMFGLILVVRNFIRPEIIGEVTFCSFSKKVKVYWRTAMILAGVIIIILGAVSINIIRNWTPLLN